MTKSWAWLAGAALLITVVFVGAQDLPAAPPTTGAAESAGLRHIDAAELNRHYAGKRMLRTARGDQVRLDLRPDGTLDYTDDKGVTDTGSWSVTARDGGRLCRRYSKQMGRRSCDIYFAAPDGVHWFGYDPDTGKWADTTRAQSPN
jgi:catechol 2,3-dioxygenase-like lactoylglutathione lyase family enzyme